MVKVMFLCTGNSCRSQMAEGLARHYGRGVIDAYSAGLAPAGVNPNAVKVMAELGIDITGQSSKPVDAELMGSMDFVITLCGHADSMCPSTPPHIKKIHWPTDDPVGATGTEEEILSEFRRARDEIVGKVRELVDKLGG
jgi:arsenate reductase